MVMGLTYGELQSGGDIRKDGENTLILVKNYAVDRLEMCWCFEQI